MRWLAALTAAALSACGAIAATETPDAEPPTRPPQPAQDASWAPEMTQDASVDQDASTGILDAATCQGDASTQPVADCVARPEPCPCGGQAWLCQGDAGPRQPADAGACVTTLDVWTVTSDGVKTWTTGHCCALL